MLETNEKLSSLESLIDLVNSNFKDNQQRDRGTTLLMLDKKQQSIC